MEVKIRHWHNHPIKASDVLRYRRPTKATKALFHAYFKKGHTPASALRMHKLDIQMEKGDLFFEDHADGSVCPDLFCCYYQYYKIFKGVYGDNYGEGMVSKLEEVNEDYNKKSSAPCAKLYQEGDDIVVALCSPLMKRAHENLPTSGEIVQLDFSVGMDRFDTRVGFLITPSLAGGLPLSELYPEGQAFHGRGLDGPKVFLTDDARNERGSLQDVYPFAILLLCLFHTLQAFLRYVTLSDHNVKKEERTLIYDDFKKLVSCKSETDFEENYQQILSNDIWLKNNIALNHLKKDLIPRAREWALCHRQDLILRGNNTTNYTESSFRQLKDLIFERLKAFNLVQLFDFLVTKLEAYYQSRIASVLNNRHHPHKKSRHSAPKPDLLVPLSSKKFSDQIFEVSNAHTKKIYTVDMEVGMCSCPVGSSGAPCKHQFKVAKDYNLSSAQFFSTCGPKDKLLCHKIMVGSVNVTNEWFKGLHDGPQVACVLSDVPIDSKIHSGPGDDGNSPDDLDEAANDLANELTHNSAEASTSELNKQQQESEEVKEWQHRLKNMCDSLSSKLEARSDTFLPGVKKLVTTYENLTAKKSENAVSSVLHWMSSILKTGNRIRCQPQTYSRRKTPHLGGRQCRQTGRPLKASRTAEHGLAKSRNRKTGPMHPVPSIKSRTIAPHSLARRVDSLRM
ncbi:Proepiregulin [Frankliniella fusca]|uniref:Proepiregulin n=1 Tax=Frankliniella fusca TaxID=407009 RepID=A0AAE1HVM7_9NEOP|nr:Proepiregulin [Frankliniella fusca]